MNRKRVANKYLINLYHVQTKMPSVDHGWLLDINKSWVNSCAEASGLMNGAAELAASLLWYKGVCTVSAAQRQIMAWGSTWDG